MEIAWVKVNSGHLDSVFYTESKKELLIRFKNNAVYRYSQIELKDYKKLTGVGSAGQYFAKYIKIKKPSKRVE